MVKVGDVPSNWRSTPCMRKTAKRLQKRANRASVFPLAGDVLLIAFSCFFYLNLKPEIQEPLGFYTLFVGSTISKMGVLIGQIYVWKCIRKETAMTARHAYNLFWKLLILRTIFGLFEYSTIVAHLFLDIHDKWMLFGLGLGLVLYYIVYTAVLHLIIQIILEPLETFLHKMEGGTEAPTASVAPDENTRSDSETISGTDP